MARLAPCSSRLLAAPVRQAPTLRASNALRGPTAARTRPPPPAAVAAAVAAEGTNAEAASQSSLRTPTRATAREQRIQEEAVAVRQAVQQGQHGKGAGSPSSGQVEAVAVQFLQAGMSKAGLIELLVDRPQIACVELWRLSGKLASVELFMKGGTAPPAGASVPPRGLHTLAMQMVALDPHRLRALDHAEPASPPSLLLPCRGEAQQNNSLQPHVPRGGGGGAGWAGGYLLPRQLLRPCAAAGRSRQRGMHWCDAD